MNQINGQQIVLGVQFLFVAFGATVLVPLLVGIDPAVALFTAGTGTLLFHLITQKKVPVFLGSSFAFIAPITASTKLYGLPATLSGLIAVGILYTIVSTIIRFRGLKLIEKLFPSVVVGPVIMVIGLSLASVGVDMAKQNWLVATVVLMVTLLTTVYGKGFFKLIPIFTGLFVGYLLSLSLHFLNPTPFVFDLHELIPGLQGLFPNLSPISFQIPPITIDLAQISNAKWFALPKFTTPEFNWNAILFMLPVAFAPMIEHIGDMYAVGAVAKKNFVKDPGLHKTLLGDGVATALAGFLGGPPNTTYSEVTGAISLTKVTNPVILRISAITAIVFSLIGKISGFLKSIPAPVLGGIMLLLFGTIASVGINTLTESHTDFKKTRNQVIVSVILTIGIGGAVLEFGDFSLSGIGLASIVGVFLNLVLPDHSQPLPHSEEMNDK
ncbi:uracil-xanthine permease family protein [Persicobacter sp. CCB-QB2]|uniref:uracil-xanthine permease family protein n=1 Tax=Persicobacter sp. CCB-QB2 TaxID=1561025 RepID=UPI0006A9456D|nr:uracil-xanthine permease family protein [Persicobacter sp. CCB-QB2]